MNWQKKNVLVTGGASFIGSHLVDALLDRGAAVRVADDLSTGTLENLQPYVDGGRVSFLKGDLRDSGVSKRAVADMDIVFHLAADHGGRGYIDRHQAACAGNLVLDGMVFKACAEAGVEKIIFASSGCVYPNHLQSDPNDVVYLTEDLVAPPYDADTLYGWAKLMGELTLRAYAAELGMHTVSCRYFTAYGERCLESHALAAMIARAFIEQDPFIVWGTGEQIRNWTYVGDIVSGTILAAECITDGTGVNLGTMERIRVADAVNEILSYTKVAPKIELHPEMPTGPLNRVADNSLARRILGWEPQTPFLDGLHRTIDWYFQNKDRATVRRTLKGVLAESCNPHSP